MDWCSRLPLDKCDQLDRSSLHGVVVGIVRQICTVSGQVWAENSEPSGTKSGRMVSPIRAAAGEAVEEYKGVDDSIFLRLRWYVYAFDRHTCLSVCSEQAAINSTQVEL